MVVFFAIILGGWTNAMSVSMSASTFGSTYTITVGSAATFTNAGSVDISISLNSEIAAAPTGDAIVIDFEPGNYGDGNPILLPSNTSVVGDDSTLTYIPGINPQTNWGMMVNKDDYSIGNSSGQIVDSKISVMGMNFVTNNADIFSTWFINAANIDVQNNVYVSGRDGNAFVSVINGIVANNVAFGMDNSAYDNWNGLVNVTVEDNSGYNYGNISSGWNVLMNSSIASINYAGSGAQYGISVGDTYNAGVIDNTFSTNWGGSGAVDTDPLLDWGYTTQANITQQGNVYQGLGVANSDVAYVGTPMANSVVENDSFIGLIQTGYGFAVINENDANTATDENINPQVIGNLVLGLQSQNVEAVIWNAGLNPTTENNADIGENLASPIVNTDNDGTTIQSAGNIINTGSTTSGSGVIPSLDIAKPATLFASVDSAILVSGLEIADITDSSTVSVTLTTTFGTLSLPAGAVGVDYTSIVDEAGVILTGSLSDVNAELEKLSYTSNPGGWDDAIEIRVSDSAGFSATSYIPVTVGDFGAGDYNGVLIFTPGEILPELDSATIPEVSTLSLDTVVGVTGDNVIQMGTTVSIVFLDAGSDTVFGGPNDAYITTGQGQAVIELAGGGNASISGGSGAMTVNAATGNNVFASGSSNALFIGGPGANTVAGGLGNLTVQGGAGSLYLATLPQDGGNLTADLGSGNSTLFALSGNDYVATQSNTENFIDLGIGNNRVVSAGADFILTGAGNDTIDATAGGSDSVLGGSGELYFAAGTGNSIVDPAAQSTILAGAGNLTVGAGGSVDLLQISQLTGTARVLTVDYVAADIPLIGYGTNPIVNQSQSGDMLNVTLSDGTLIELFDPGYLAAAVISGTLGLVPWTGIAAPDVVNLDNMLESTASSRAVDNQIIETALSEVPSGKTAILNTDLSSPGGLVNNGTLVLDPTHLTLDNPLTGEGVIEIDTGSGLEINGSVASTQTIAFVGTIGSLILGDAKDFLGTITGFDPGYNVIDLSNISFSSKGFATLTSGNILDVIENGQTTAIQLDPLQSYAANVFDLSNDGLNGTSITDATDYTLPSGIANLNISGPTPGTETIYGNGSNNFHATFGSLASVVFNSGGSGTLAALGAGDFLGLINGSWSVFAGGGDSIDSSAQNATINTYGTANVVGLLGGSTTIDGGATHDLIETFNAGVSAVVNVTGNGENILVDGGADTVDALGGQSGTDAFFNISGGSMYFVNNSTMTATVSGAVFGAIGGSVTAFGGVGGGTYAGGPGGNNSLVGGTGLVSMFGAGTGNFLEANGSVAGSASNLLSVGSSGSSTLVASASTNWNQFYGGAYGTTSMSSAGSGQQNFFVGDGDTETITGSTTAGAVNVYHFEAPSIGSGVDYITNFKLGASNVILIDETGPYQGQVSIAGAETLGGGQGGTAIQLSDNTTIKLIGTYLTQAQITSITGSAGFQ